MPLRQKTALAVRAVLQDPQTFDEEVIWRVADLMKSAGPSSRPGIVAALLRALQAQEPLVRQHAAVAFWGIRDPATVPALLKAMRDSDIEVCRKAATSLGRIGDAAVVRGLCDAIADPNPEVRIIAIGELGSLKAREAVAPLLAALHDPVSHVRRAAASSLGGYEDKAVVPVLLQALRDPDARVRFTAVRSLEDTDDLAVAQGLLEVLQDPDQEVRFIAVRSPALRKAPGAVARLLVTLRDPYHAVRRDSAAVLGLIRDAAAVEQLLAALRRERIGEVRRSICWALGEIAAATAKAAQSAAVAAETVWKAVLPALSKARNGDPSVIVRVQALQVLEGLGTEYNPDAAAKDLSDVPPLSDKMLQEAAEARKQLHTFCLIGEILEADHMETFVIAWMARRLREQKNLRIRETTIRDHLRAVKKLFEAHLPDLGLLWDGGQGQRGYAITPQWWPAWRIAMQALGRNLTVGPDGQAPKKLTNFL